MARITINEISQNYAYAIGNASYAEVALPITASWGPGFVPHELNPTVYDTDDDVLEDVEWQRFSATNEGLEKFIATYRGKASFADQALDKSFQSAATLLSSGFDVVACRVGCGAKAITSEMNLYDLGQGKTADVSGIAFSFKPYVATPVQDPADHNETQPIQIVAKYPGSFGNMVSVKVTPTDIKFTTKDRTEDQTTGKSVAVDTTSSTINVVVYIVADGGKTAVENFNVNLGSLYYTSQYVDIALLDYSAVHASAGMNLSTGDTNPPVVVTLSGGDDGQAFASTPSQDIRDVLVARGFATSTTAESVTTYTPKTSYYTAVTNYSGQDKTAEKYKVAFIREWTFLKSLLILNQLTDRLSYSNNMLISVWDDQDFKFYGYTNVPSTIGGEDTDRFIAGPLDMKLMEISCKSRCAAAFLGTPRSLKRDQIKAYAALVSELSGDYTDDGLAATHGTMFGPWGRIRYQGESLMDAAHPAFLALMMMRSMSKNSSSQYYWALPTNRKVNLNLGDFDYKLSQVHLDSWQAKSGVDVNALVKLPELGTCLWGNSTLFNVPEATYNALQNLSTRLLFNELRDWSYRCGLSITYQYNNAQAYSAFYAGMVPILDSMRNVGAIDDYRIEVNAELDELGQVMANSVLGKIYLVVNGVVNDLTVDLIAMPAGTVLA